MITPNLVHTSDMAFLNDLEKHRRQQARQMREKFRNRVLGYSLDRQEQEKHKVISYALHYGATPRTAYRAAKPYQ